VAVPDEVTTLGVATPELVVEVPATILFDVGKVLIFDEELDKVDLCLYELDALNVVMMIMMFGC
jgi:hypothetical protein